MAASAPSVGLVGVTPTATACGWLPPCTHVDFVRAACTPGSCWLPTRSPAFRVWLSRTPAYGALVMLTAIGSPLAMAVASAEAVRTDLKLAVSRTAAGLIKSWRGQGERSQILRFVQPSLIGLIDGTISTLAPIFAAAFLVGSHGALLVGLAASLGAAISMGLSEALSDDGELSGRGNSLVRGTLTGMATFVGGTFHALPFLISDTQTALKVAYVVVGIELITIAWVRRRFLQVPLHRSLIQVTMGGFVVAGLGALIGHA